MFTPRVKLPATAAKGTVIEIRTLIDHPMITAVSSDMARDMLATFTATMNGAPLFGYDFFNGSAANPTFTFYARIDETAQFVFTWTHEDGRTFTATETVTMV